MHNKKLQNGLITPLLGFFLLMQLFACARPHPVQTEKIPAPGRKPAFGIAELEKQIHLLINRERRKNGLSSLSWNDSLSRIARKHSQDMAKRAYFSHNSPEGHDFSYRYQQGGFMCAVPVKEIIYTGAENLFQNNLYNRIVYVNGAAQYEWNTVKRIAETTVEGWMKSPGHRKNILTPHWKSEGIGIAISPDDKVYITENFC